MPKREDHKQVQDKLKELFELLEKSQAQLASGDDSEIPESVLLADYQKTKRRNDSYKFNSGNDEYTLVQAKNGDFVLIRVIDDKKIDVLELILSIIANISEGKSYQVLKKDDLDLKDFELSDDEGGDRDSEVEAGDDFELVGNPEEEDHQDSAAEAGDDNFGVEVLESDEEQEAFNDEEVAQDDEAANSQPDEAEIPAVKFNPNAKPFAFGGKENVGAAAAL